MRSHIIQALVGVKHVRQSVRKEVIAAIDSSHEGADFTFVALEERSHVVAELPVPLKPKETWETPAEFVRRNVPCLSDQPDSCKSRIGVDLRQDRWVLEIERSVVIAGEDRGQIEAETVHMHLCDPIAHAIEDQDRKSVV